MAFDEFLDMFSVFSETAPREIKSAYAFKIYDYDNDNHLGKNDLKETLNAVTKNDPPDNKYWPSEDINFVIKKVLEETDLDKDEKLSYIEFENVVSQAPDFISTFQIRI